MLYGFLAKVGVVSYAISVVVLMAMGDLAEVVKTFFNSLAGNLTALGVLIGVATKCYIMLKSLEKKIDQNTEITKLGAEATVLATVENKDEISKVGQKVTSVEKVQADGLLVASDKQIDLTVQIKQLEAERDAARTEAVIKAAEAEREKTEREDERLKGQEISASHLRTIAERDAKIAEQAATLEQRANLASAIQIINPEVVAVNLESMLKTEPQD